MGLAARQRHVDFIGIDDAALALRHQQALDVIVGDALGDVVARALPGQLQKADGVEEQAGDADDRQKRQNAEGQPLGILARQQEEGGERRHEEDGKENHQRGAAAALGTVDGGRGGRGCGRRVGHLGFAFRDGHRNAWRAAIRAGRRSARVDATMIRRARLCNGTLRPRGLEAAPSPALSLWR